MDMQMSIAGLGRRQSRWWLQDLLAATTNNNIWIKCTKPATKIAWIRDALVLHRRYGRVFQYFFLNIVGANAYISQLCKHTNKAYLVNYVHTTVLLRFPFGIRTRVF
jgi:hypothetical protein